MIVNGTTYHNTTPKRLVKLLERLRANQARVSIVYGDTKTGKPWDACPRSGRIGRSMGPIKIPLLIHNSRCSGGDGVFDDCILEVRYANKKQGGVLYKYNEDVGKTHSLPTYPEKLKPDPKTGRYPCDQGPFCPTECSGSKNPDGRCHWAPLLDKAYWG